MLRAQRGPTEQASILYVVCWTLRARFVLVVYIRVAAIVLLLSRSAQAVLERRVPSVYTSLHIGDEVNY